MTTEEISKIPAFMQALERMGRAEPETMVREVLGLFRSIQNLDGADLIPAWNTIKLFHEGLSNTDYKVDPLKRQLVVIQKAIYAKMKAVARTSPQTWEEMFKDCVGSMHWTYGL